MQPAVERYVARLADAGLEVEVREFSESTHTAGEAATAIGCPVAAIVKSLVFELDGEPLLVLASGADAGRHRGLGARLGGTITKADAATVKSATGYSIGAVPPLGHDTPLRTCSTRPCSSCRSCGPPPAAPAPCSASNPQALALLSGAEVVRGFLAPLPREHLVAAPPPSGPSRRRGPVRATRPNAPATRPGPRAPAPRAATASASVAGT